MLAWPPKDPDEVLDYHVNWLDEDEPVLEDGETILEFDFFLEDGDVTIDSISEAAGVCTAWVSGGVVGDTNTITNRVVTSAGRTYDQTVKLRIRSK